MKKYPEAREAFGAILRDYPKSPLTVQATNFLSYMQERGV
jgi:TolA-binding protein